MKSLVFKLIRCACAGGFVLAGLAAPRFALAAPEQQFATPEAAVQALTAAAKTKDHQALAALFGPELHGLVSADAVQSSNRFALFAKRISQKAQLVRKSDDEMVLDIGNEAWPFPIPLVKRDNQWSFDTAAGKVEILNRRIGNNELGAIAVCHAYVNAQREYAGESHDGDEVLQYAQWLRSSPNKHDGLFWRAQPGEEASPFGPLLAQAHNEGYSHESRIMTLAQKPYHGYYFRILTRQGAHAPGGKYSYIINGRMIAGFALVAWPAQWGNSGLMTFIVNQQGKVYEKCLGKDTARAVKKITSYNPDSTWTLTTE